MRDGKRDTDALLLNTESGEQSTVITGEHINKLPLNFGGGGENVGGIRSANAFNVLSPGVAGSSNPNGRHTANVNGFHAPATRDVAAESKVPPVYLYLLSRALLESMSQEQADGFNAAAHADARAESAAPAAPDRTHLNERGIKPFRNAKKDILGGFSNTRRLPPVCGDYRNCDDCVSVVVQTASPGPSVPYFTVEPPVGLRNGDL